MKYFHFVTFLFLFSSFNLSSQLTITGYSTFAIGAETKLYKNLSGEFRVYTNDILYDSNMEVQFYYGFTPRKYHQIRLGAGMNGNIFNGEVNSIQFPVQLIIFPLQDLKRLAFVIEVTPQWLTLDELSPDTLILRNLWGVRYSFGKE